MKILITGGSGFIGRNLFEYLQRRYAVLAPTHKELELFDDDAVKRYLRLNKFDVIIHSASMPASRKVKAPRDIAIGNLRMFFNLVRNSDCFPKMIFLGTGAEYDQRYDISRVKEGDPDRRVPADELGFSKWACSKYIETSGNIVNLRLFGVFGKYEDYHTKFISNAICKVIYSLPITVKQNRIFSYLYIDDLCKVVDYFVNNTAKRRIYNVAPHETFELLSLAKKVNEISRKNPEIIVHTSGFGKEYTADNSLLMNEIGSFRFTPIEEAIGELYKWYEDNKDNIDRDLLLYDP